MSVHGGKVLMRKVYNRFPDMVDDESLLGNIMIIEQKGKEYWEKFILELKSEPPNNLPEEDTTDWRTRITDVGGKSTMVTWIPTNDPENDIATLRNYLEYHENLYYTDPDNVEISDYDYDMKMKELERLETENPEFKSEDSPSVRVGFEGSETQSSLEKHLKDF
tara:strand:+ start:1608 stop:2099 length:492 start_codon:yes stop_codon:yes gene_type:complete